MRRLTITAAAIALAFAGGTAYAHPKLVSASPANNAAVATPARITLNFSERLVPAFSKAELVMAAMPGMAEMKMASATAVSADGKTLTVTPKSRLSRGRYMIHWNVVSSDTHKVEGHLMFSVK